MKRTLLIAFIFVLSGLAQAQCSGTGSGVIAGVGAWQCGLGVVVAGLENSYCTKGTGLEQTEGTPTWGATDDLAALPTQCMYTGLDATPSPGNIYTPGTSATLTNVLASANGGTAVNADGTTGGGTGHLACGDLILLTANTTYTGEFVAPNLPCDGAHWITWKSTGVTDANISNGNFPGEGVRATPCIAGISNDSVNGRNVPGYPDYACPSYPAVLSAKIMQPAVAADAALSFASGANHYRFIGIEFAKNPTVSVDQIVRLVPSGPNAGVSLGANHIIFDRSINHGVQWTPAAGTTEEAGNNLSAKNSQWVALVNGWNYDTYCNSSCVDSHAYSAGTGAYQDGPHKIYNMLMATAGESWMFGGGGQGPGTPNTAQVEIRSNHSFRPLTWMLQINTCSFYRQPVTKNLGEFKSMTFALVEGNVYENSWQGCQSDQSGYAQLFNPGNQNNHQGMTVTFDGSNVVTTTSNFTHHASGIAGNPSDAANCPPGGCILEDTNPPAGATVDYRFCNGVNGCDQSGIPGLKCGTGVNAGLSCTTDGQCPGSYCAPTTSARLANSATPPAGTRTANACVPGDCPGCKNKDITFRFNDIYNVTNGLQINTGLSSICRDQAAGMANISIRDNEFHALDREMSNGNDPYSGATAFALSNNSLPPSVIGFIGIRHNTIAVSGGNPQGVSGLGNQVDRSDIQYLQGLAWTDNVSPASLTISKGSGSKVTKGIGGQPGLAKTYAVNSCQRYFTAEAPDGTLTSAGVQNFNFAGLPAGGTNYLVSRNGQYTAITAQLATSFTVTAAMGAGDTIVVRDLNDCNWTYAYNVLGNGISANFHGSGQDQSPYPSIVAGVSIRPDSKSCGAGNLQECILDETAVPGSFINNFVAWGTGRTGDFSIAGGSPFFQTASDALSRPPSGKSPGADFGLLAAKVAGVRGLTYLPALTVTTTSLPPGTHGVAYSAVLQASVGASQFWDGYKGWFLETDSTKCGGNCGSLNNGAVHSGVVINRGGIVNGPIPILTISRTGCPGACLSNYTVSSTIVAGAWEAGQTVSMANFLNGVTTANDTDSTFNGVCAITALGTNAFSCRQAGDVAGTNIDKGSHPPNGPKGPANGCGLLAGSQCDSTASFAPIAAGTYTFWVGARDGAFQIARGSVSVTIN